jgi:phosphinothricin acetyltransferase
LIVRAAGIDDVEAITDLKNALLATTAIEWTDEPHTAAEIAAWLDRQSVVGNPVLVAVVDDDVAGWASYGDSRDSAKWPGYRFTVEHTIHVADGQRGAGSGRGLMLALIERAVADGYHRMVGGIDGDNEASIRFHERLGFVPVAHLPEVGFKFGRWLDLVLMQRMLGA